MAYDQTTLETQLASVQSAITAALAESGPNYRVGNTWVNRADYLKTLFAQQKELIEQLKSFPTEVANTHQDLITEFGEDLTDYKNEEGP